MATPASVLRLGEELQRAQRYFQVNNFSIGQIIASSQAYFAGAYSVPMRTSGSATLLSGSSAVNEIALAIRDISSIADGGGLRTQSFYIGVQLSGGASGNRAWLVQGAVGFDADL